MTTRNEQAILMLEDGACFTGSSCGARGEAFGEICFNTAVVGYLEIISNPAYAGQIVTMTYPQIGNYGVVGADLQSDVLSLRGLVVHDICHTPSSFRSEMDLPEFLRQEGVVAICDIDTRALAQHIRDNGSQRAGISTVDLDPASLLEKVKASPTLASQNLVPTVSTQKTYEFIDTGTDYDFILKPPLPVRHHVVVYDNGLARSVLRDLQRAGCKLTVVPWDTPAASILALEPDGVFISGGPGNPEAAQEAIEAAGALLGHLPVFGMGLGHQILALAAGGKVERLTNAHHGSNLPVMDLRTRSVAITEQNHGFGIDFASLGYQVSNEENVVCNERFGRIQLSHINLNDNSPEGIAFLDIPALSVQFNPASIPGESQPHALISAFTTLMEQSSAKLAGGRSDTPTDAPTNEPADAPTDKLSEGK